MATSCEVCKVGHLRLVTGSGRTYKDVKGGKTHRAPDGFTMWTCSQCGVGYFVDAELKAMMRDRPN